VSAPPNRVAGEPEVLQRTTTLSPRLVATWVSATGRPVPDNLSVELDDAVSAHGGIADVVLPVRAPAEAGTYLLLLDVLTPDSGPMSSLGTAPAIVRVTVNDAAPTPTPAPTIEPTPVAPSGKG
jgi:hypothetical protein